MVQINHPVGNRKCTAVSCDKVCQSIHPCWPHPYDILWPYDSVTAFNPDRQESGHTAIRGLCQDNVNTLCIQMHHANRGDSVLDIECGSLICQPSQLSASSTSPTIPCSFACLLPHWPFLQVSPFCSPSALLSLTHNNLCLSLLVPREGGPLILKRLSIKKSIPSTCSLQAPWRPLFETDREASSYKSA